MEKEKKKVCWIRVLKNLAYCIAPILILSLILSIISVVYAYEIGMERKAKDYFETTKFAEEYYYSIYNATNQVLIIEESTTEEEKQNYRNNYDYYSYSAREIEVDGKQMQCFYNYYPNNFDYLVIDNKNNVVYVNREYDISHTTLESLKNEILPNKLYWIYEDGKIDTTITKLNEENIKNTNFYKEDLSKGNYTIYTAIKDELPYYDSYLSEKIMYDIVKNINDYAIYSIPITLILLIACIPIILIGIGKTKNSDKIYLNWFDKLLVEGAIALLILLDFISCLITFGLGTSINAIFSVICIALGTIVIYISLILLLETIVKRLKTHTFIKTTFAYWLYDKIKLVFGNIKISVKVICEFIGFGLANCIGFIVTNEEPFLGFIILAVTYTLALIYILKRTIWIEKISEAIEQVYKGNTNVKLDTSQFKGNTQKIALQVNDIAGGLSNAVEERLKSERLKTELITNVSHDIKTPLTSIINYVDLLKKEDITSPKAMEYLTILDNKSQRLKKLTEDLVEASKASSGNIKLNIEKLEVNELIKQVSVEFEEKFKNRGLKEIITFAQKPVYINADSRYMYRVLENIYSNVSKYAMENSRVYTDIIEHGNNVIIQIKNISKDKLNITADELMQRFVRADASRNTEGSGLGLSIASSLTSLQNGKFHIYLDGDLFKVTIGFKKVI